MRFRDFDELLSVMAQTAPIRCALRYGGKSWTYRQLRLEARARADYYRSLGKSCLGVLADGSADCVINLFGAALAGLQIVMLDASLPDEAYPALLHYTDVDCLWGDPDLVNDLTPHLGKGVTDGAGKILFFTSGTTSRSKAVELTQYSLCQSAYNGSALLPLGAEDTLLCLLPLGHVFGFVCGLLWGLACGATVALGRGPRHYAEDCGYYRPTALSAVPLLLGFLIKTNALNPELVLILIGAGDCPANILCAAKATGARVSFGYGLTETSSGVALSLGDDPYAMTICPDDTITIAEDGEILIDAPTCRMSAYYKHPEASAAAWEGGVLHTGDLGFIDGDGLLHITGRKKDILVLPDGTKIFLPEYEEQLMRALGFAELAVTLKEGRPVLICPAEAPRGVGLSPNEGALLRVLSPLMKTLPRGQQITEIVFTDGPLPRTATGKIKRYELNALVEKN